MCGVLATMAVISYFKFTTKAQANESISLMQSTIISVSNNITQKGQCTLEKGKAQTLKGKYGVLTISGELKPSMGLSCDTGCTLTYTFNSTGVSKQLAGKKVVAQILNNMKLSKVAGSTTVDDRYLPWSFSTVSTMAGDNCTALNESAGQSTNGSGTSGTEKGEDTGSVLPGVELPPPSPPPAPEPTPTPTPTPEPPLLKPEGEEYSSRTKAYWMNQRAAFGSYQVYPVVYFADKLIVTQWVDPRNSSVYPTVATTLKIPVSARAKSATVTFSFVNGSSTTVTMLSKKLVTGKTDEYNFGFTALIDFDCQTASRCRNAMIKNTNGEYSAVTEPLMALFQKNLTRYDYKPGVPFSLDKIGKDFDLNVKINY